MTGNPNMARTFPPPVMEARRWMADATFPPERPLINVSQAAPVDPPPEALRAEIARVAMHEAEAHLYGPVLGLPELRAQVASDWSSAYGGEIAADQVAITSGCNQAFASMIAALAGPEDEVLLPTPWYFNHKMWLDMSGIKAVPLPSGDGMLPDTEVARSLITDRTRAIALVTPNNPCGVEYPGGLVRAFFDLCRDAGITLIVDETYRDFDSRSGAPHDLFETRDWDQTLVHLYSFSKAYRLTGHRVGAVVTKPDLLAEAEKFLDTVAICPNQIGQRAALWGMQNLGQWLAGERAEILDRRAAIEDNMHRLPDWTLLGVGAYFAYVQHPFDLPSDELAKRLVQEAGVLCLPGTMFTPDGDAAGKQQLRIAFANVDRAGIGQLFDRLQTFVP